MKNHPDKIKMSRVYNDEVFAFIPTKMDDGTWVWLEKYKVVVLGLVYAKHQKKIVVSKKKI